MSKRQKELETFLAKHQSALDSLESRMIDRMNAVKEIKSRVIRQQNFVDDARNALNRWVNAPTKTKQQVMAKAKEMGVIVNDQGLYEEIYTLEVNAPQGYAFNENELQWRDFEFHTSDCTKNMLWHIVYEFLDDGLREREEEEA